MLTVFSSDWTVAISIASNIDLSCGPVSDLVKDACVLRYDMTCCRLFASNRLLSSLSSDDVIDSSGSVLLAFSTELVVVYLVDCVLWNVFVGMELC